MLSADLTLNHPPHSRGSLACGKTSTTTPTRAAGNRRKPKAGMWTSCHELQLRVEPPHRGNGSSLIIATYFIFTTSPDNRNYEYEEGFAGWCWPDQFHVNTGPNQMVDAREIADNGNVIHGVRGCSDLCHCLSWQH
jgi:hypothetical protein